jgi:HEAT repeat protein
MAGIKTTKMKNQFKDTLTKIATDAQLQTSHLFIFSKMDKAALGVFQAEWPTIATERRREVVQELVEIAEMNFEVNFSPVFLLGMADVDAQVRTQAIAGLWEQEEPALIGPFIHLLRTDEAAMVRAAAATALGQFVYLYELEELEEEYIEPVKQALLETIYLPGEDVDVRRRAVESVAFFSGPEIIQIIESAYYDENDKMQVSAIFAMGRNADGQWRPRVLAELDNHNSEIRFEAARACGELEVAEAVPKLVALIAEDIDLQVQEVAIWALGRIGGPAAREALEHYAESETEALAMAAEEALDEINIFDAALDLFDFDEDDDEEDDDYDELDDYAGKYYLN